MYTYTHYSYTWNIFFRFLRIVVYMFFFAFCLLMVLFSSILRVNTMVCSLVAKGTFFCVMIRVIIKSVFVTGSGNSTFVHL